MRHSAIFSAVVTLALPVHANASPVEAAAVAAIYVDRGPPCAPGYVWREARYDDYACVTPDERSRAWSENSDAPRRWMNGAYGPHTCVAGFVWREAYSGDDVCVAPERRSAVAAENAAAASRVAAMTVPGPVMPFPLPLPDMAPRPGGGILIPPILMPSAGARCVSGFVWREARAGDYACVVPESRTRAQAENRVAASRWTAGPYGPRTCVGGFVWREAFSGDEVCVTPEVRDLVRSENSEASRRRL